MASFVVKVDDTNGRHGVLDIGRERISTPLYVPSDDIWQAMRDIPGGSAYCRSGVCEYDIWIRHPDIERIRLHPEERELLEREVRERMSRVRSSAKMIHFNFFSDVMGLDKESLIRLLCLQYQAGADVIEIPHGFCSVQAYERMVRYALEWQHDFRCDTSLMGIAHSAADLTMLNRYLPQLGGVGIDCRRFNKPLLYQVRKLLKPQDVWVHAFSAPLRYREVDNQGTLGMLINWFGVDTVSTITQGDPVREYFTYLFSRMEGQEKTECLKQMRYFAPTDYSTPTFGDLEVSYGDSHRLSSFCDCPVCRNLTIGDAMENLPDLYLNNQLHRAFAYYRESQKCRHALINNETDRFLAGKLYAAEIIRRSGGTLAGRWPGNAPVRKVGDGKVHVSRIARRDYPLPVL
ncbi:hypothetical protein [Methanogenium cariaci]|jgi:hypothetical protein